MKKEVLEGLKGVVADLTNDIRIEDKVKFTYALRINELLAEELKNETNTALRKESKLDLYKFVLTGQDANIRPSMACVYYEDGTAVASDMMMLVADKRDYPAEYEGKAIRKDGTEQTEQRYPQWRNVLPSDWGKLTDMGVLDYAELDNAIKVADGMDKTRISIASENDTDAVFYTTIKRAKVLRTFLKAKGSVRLYASIRTVSDRNDFSKTVKVCNTIYSRDDNTQMVCMGTTKPEYEDAIYEIRIR